MYYNNFVNGSNNPYIYNLRTATLLNDSPYQNIWTGEIMQVNVVNLNPNENIQMDMHPDIDELIYVMEGQGRIIMGNEKDSVQYDSYIVTDNAVFIPAGTWHQLINQFCFPLKFIKILAYCNK